MEFIRRVQLETLVALSTVQVPNTSNARYFADADGRRWVGKHVSDSGHEAILGEALGWILAMEVDAPIPDACVAGAGTDLIWLSEQVENVVHWDVGLAGRVQNASSFGGILAVDCLLMNGDRHLGNILMEPASRGDLFRMWAIDFDHSLVGWPDDFAKNLESVPATKDLARGLPVKEMRVGARSAAKNLSLYTRTVLEPFVAEACSIATETKTVVLLDALEARAQRALELTDRYLLAIEGMP